ncbi:MAG: conjugative transposon protein TraK [Bacteroidetes bacterium 43-16]|uniref:conjugative transposon protein TraK n=1 Tax=uncultured Dysgonomonas sp. TaxID=206096 RepID=UPI0009277A8F|nr:conjugative transposon protein TraK [uncultured Dysgonomonas sp.]OJV51026.1 MAG: conjugative transposon protein TraK [Bacteroidetes bacterium 43-16]
MFTKAKNIDTAFRQFRLFAFVIVLASVVNTIFTVTKCFNLVSNMKDKIYVLANDKAIEAFATDRKNNIIVEAKNHIKTFHQFFFTLDPDDDAIRNSIERALYLADESAKKVYDDLKENKFYSGIISGNVNQTIRIDSTQVDISAYPYSFRCYATQQIIRPATITTRTLITTGSLREISRTDNNPHGFLIERWTTLDNRDIKTVNRR